MPLGEGYLGTEQNTLKKLLTNATWKRSFSKSVQKASQEKFCIFTSRLTLTCLPLSMNYCSAIESTWLAGWYHTSAVCGYQRSWYSSGDWQANGFLKALYLQGPYSNPS